MRRAVACLALALLSAPAPARSAAAPDHVLELDGEALGPAGEVHRWAPTPGRHVLALRGAGWGGAVNSVVFEVRGATR